MPNYFSIEGNQVRFPNERVSAGPIGMVHIEQPGQPIGTKFEIGIQGMSPAEAGIMKDTLNEAMNECIRNINDPKLAEDTTNAVD